MEQGTVPLLKAKDVEFIHPTTPLPAVVLHDVQLLLDAVKRFVLSTPVQARVVPDVINALFSSTFIGFAMTPSIKSSKLMARNTPS
ncbi:MAG: hypothetical protein MUE30_18840, partial [Spirosomaceae bacterium]|nr:hypothetical protein [Spirosomataceae bacterium]